MIVEASAVPQESSLTKNSPSPPSTTIWSSSTSPSNSNPKLTCSCSLVAVQSDAKTRSEQDPTSACTLLSRKDAASVSPQTFLPAATMATARPIVDKPQQTAHATTQRPALRFGRVGASTETTWCDDNASGSCAPAFFASSESTKDTRWDILTRLGPRYKPLLSAHCVPCFRIWFSPGSASSAS